VGDRVVDEAGQARGAMPIRRVRAGAVLREAVERRAARRHLAAAGKVGVARKAGSAVRGFGRRLAAPVLAGAVGEDRVGVAGTAPRWRGSARLRGGVPEEAVVARLEAGGVGGGALGAGLVIGA